MALNFNPFTGTFDVISNVAKKIWDIAISNTTPTNGQVLAYNSSTGEWEPQNQLEYSSGFEEIENTYVAKIANNGTTASIIEQRGGFIDSVTRTGAGLVTITFTSGFFTVAPIARFETPNNTGVEVHEADLDAPTTVDNAYVYTRTALSYNPIDVDFEIVVHRSGTDRNEATIYYDASYDIDGRIETLTTDTANDYLIMYDASEAANRKVTPENLGLTTPPAGSDTQVQFNDGGSFGANSEFVWDNANGRLGVNNSAPNADLCVGSLTSAVDRSFRLQRSGGIEFRFNINSSQCLLYASRDFFITTNTTSRQIYMVPGGGATCEFDNNQTTFFRAMGYPIRTVTTDTTIGTTDYTVLVDTSGGDVTVTLPAASSSQYRVYNIKKVTSDLNKVIVDGNASETIDGALTANVTVQYESLTIQCDSTSWWVL